MPSTAERQRNNVRAGVFVTVVLLIALAVVVVLTDAIDALSRSTRDYRVTFDVATGVSNLKPGSDVRVGGVTMGRVGTVTPLLEQGKAFRMIAVDFSLDRRIDLYANASILIAAPLIGSDAWLEIPHVGDPTAGSPQNNMIAGTVSTGFLTTLLGAENAGRTSEILTNVNRTSASLTAVTSDLASRWPEWSDQADSILENTQSLTGDVKAITEDVREKRYPTWADSVDKVFTWAVDSREKLSATIDEGHNLLKDSRGVIAENREQVKAIVGNVQDTTERIKTETVDKVHALLDTGQMGLDQAVKALEDLRVDYAAWSTNVGEALANANLASQQLKLTTIEARRSPWKLLYRPSSEELEHELLYESARSFAIAAADLKAAAESVQRVMRDHRDLIAEDQQTYRRIEGSLLKSLDNYEKAQQQLIDVIFADEVK